VGFGVSFVSSVCADILVVSGESVLAICMGCLQSREGNKGCRSGKRQRLKKQRLEKRAEQRYGYKREGVTRIPKNRTIPSTHHTNCSFEKECL
jgi:hypothetical protein